MSDDCGEVLLHGGITNAGLVSRVGDTVRRPGGPTSPATHALLEHLERVGFDGAPRFLGVDERGREILSYIPGEAAIEPYQDWALTDEALVSVAELLRRYHDAVASFDAAGHTWPAFVPAEFRDGLVSHNDPNLDNVIFSGGRAVALIDFDLAGPGSAVWDVACAARLWAPLRDERDAPDGGARPGAGAAAHLRRRLRRSPRRDRERVVDAVVHTHDWCYDVVRDALARGHRASAATGAKAGGSAPTARAVDRRASRADARRAARRPLIEGGVERLLTHPDRYNKAGLPACHRPGQLPRSPGYARAGFRSRGATAAGSPVTTRIRPEQRGAHVAGRERRGEQHVAERQLARVDGRDRGVRAVAVAEPYRDALQQR